MSNYKSLSLGTNVVKYVEVGSGEPMVFLHNAGSGHWIWHYQIQHFAKKYRVLAFDMLGFGASDRPNVAYNLNFYTQMIDEILVQLNLRNVVLVGNCIGAATALEYAIRDPSRLKALILFNLCGGRDMMTPSVRMVSIALPNFLEPIHRVVLQTLERSPWVLSAARRTTYASPLDSSDPVALAERKQEGNPAQTQSGLNVIKGLSSFNKFSHDFIRPPFLPPIAVFWGRQNCVLPVNNGLRFCTRLRPTRTYIIENTGHMSMAERPKYVNAQMENFLNLIGTDNPVSAKH